MEISVMKFILAGKAILAAISAATSNKGPPMILVPLLIWLSLYKFVCHSRESGNPGRHWIPGQARNDRKGRSIWLRIATLQTAFKNQALDILSIRGFLNDLSLFHAINPVCNLSCHGEVLFNDGKSDLLAHLLEDTG